MLNSQCRYTKVKLIYNLIKVGKEEHISGEKKTFLIL